MRKRILLFVLAGALLVVAGRMLFAAFVYPVGFEESEEAYRELARLTLECCSSGDYMTGRDGSPFGSARDPEMRALMRRVGADRVHYYPGNAEHPGAVVYIERNPIGPISGMYAYSLNGKPKKITGCYTSEHVRGKWYRSHSLFCLP